MYSKEAAHMCNCGAIKSLSSSYSVSEEENASTSFASPFTRPFTRCIRDFITKLFPKKIPILVGPPSCDSKDETVSWTTLDFNKLVEEACLKVWGMLREHLKQMNQYHEEQEKFYRQAIKEQVKSYLSWVGTALQVAGVATGICSISFTLLPGPSTEICKKALQRANIFKFEWFEKLIHEGGLAPGEAAKAAMESLKTAQGIFSSFSAIQSNYASADRVSAQGFSEISSLRMDKVSKEEDSESNRRDGVLQTIQQQYQQEAEARKAISR